MGQWVEAGTRVSAWAGVALVLPVDAAVDCSLGVGKDCQAGEVGRWGYAVLVQPHRAW
jgi:hypothetical protein